MTRLILTPLDPNAPGSFRERLALYELIGELDRSTKARDMAAQAGAYGRLVGVIVKRLHTDDGTDVQAALDELSASDFDALLLGATAESSVPLASASS